MAHSHLVIQHLLQQLTRFAAEKKERPSRQPEWLSGVVDQVSQLFEPFSGVARVGYETELMDDCWELRMYLGSTEIIGGKDDGQWRSMNFDFNVLELISLFTKTASMQWSAIATATDSGRSFLTITGDVSSEPLRLKIYAFPPKAIGPALRMHADGTFYKVQATADAS